MEKYRLPTMKNSSKQLRNNAILNVLKQLATVVFPLITFPYVTKTLGAEHYGQVNYTASLISYVALIAGLGINNYAIRECSRLRDNKSDLDRFINEIITLNGLAMIVAYVLLAIMIVYYHSIPTYQILLIIQGISVLFTVVGCEWLNVVYEDYAYTTVRYILFQGLAVCLTFLSIKSPRDIYKYAVISQLATVLGNIANIVHFSKKWNIRYRPILSSAIFKHLKSVLILFGNAVSMLIYVNSDITLIGIMCGDTDVGIYSVAVKIYTIVKQLLNAMILVAVPRLARWTGTKSKEEVSGQLNEMLKIMVVVLIPAIVGLFSLSNPIVVQMSDVEYETASGALQVLSVTLLFSVGVCFYSNLVLIPNNMENQILRASVISALINLTLNLLLIPKYGFIAAAYTSLASEAFMALYLVMVSRKKYFPDIGVIFFLSIISGLLVYMCCGAVELLKYGNLLRIILSIIVSVVSWGMFWLTIYVARKILLRHGI